MARALDFDELRQALLRRLALTGPAGAPELTPALGISQPVFSRLVASMRRELLVVGRARKTRYAAYRSIADVGSRIPVYAIDERGKSRQLARLHAVLPEGFYVEGLTADVQSQFYKDLPYFLSDLRPSGFLGRLIPRRHPELGVPNDILVWSSDHFLRWAARYGWNLSGNLIVGDEAFRLYLANTRSVPDLVAAGQRSRRYPEFARDVLNAGAPGSSAAGEQPKFLVTRTPGFHPVLVKFSPPLEDRVGRRMADLLVAEHIAHQVLRAHKHGAPASELVRAGNRMFLEVARFDRVGRRGRRGVVSLMMLDGEFVGRLLSWSDTGAELERHGVIDAAILTEIRWRELFGKLIANSDMHFGNLSLFVKGTRVTGLAPAYDMLPMSYSPQQAHITEAHFEPPLPSAADAAIWPTAYRAALDFWGRVASHRLVSGPFRKLAHRNHARLLESRDVAALLPKGAE
jgi:hypothetical protein